uniref:Uncharacterized protein n=1 Tax=Physcomitrium patens TaxID=3218 RepID=A0A2K1KK05_PHYPA|nr:hypothetical protein PHYPA_007787 [Physcomitrium patens]
MKCSAGGGVTNRRDRQRDGQTDRQTDRTEQGNDRNQSFHGLAGFPPQPPLLMIHHSLYFYFFLVPMHACNRAVGFLRELCSSVVTSMEYGHCAMAVTRGWG